jgi:hypothetical protein
VLELRLIQLERVAFPVEALALRPDGGERTGGQARGGHTACRACHALLAKRAAARVRIERAKLADQVPRAQTWFLKPPRLLRDAMPNFLHGQYTHSQSHAAEEPTDTLQTLWRRRQHPHVLLAPMDVLDSGLHDGHGANHPRGLVQKGLRLRRVHVLLDLARAADSVLQDLLALG